MLAFLEIDVWHSACAMHIGSHVLANLIGIFGSY